jgi:hypothetical protein
MTAKKKALVIGNCQVKSLAETLNLFVEDVDFSHLQVHSIAPDKIEAYLDTQADKARTIYDFILSFELSGKFFAMSKENIRTTFLGKDVLFISNIWFDGYFPDIVTLGDAHGRLDGPLAQYRSRIAMFGFMSGWSLERTVRAFSPETYEAAGYFSNWTGSVSRLAGSDETVDIRFNDTLANLVRDRLCMYVLNHPTPMVFHRWAMQISDGLERLAIAKGRRWTPAEALVPAYFTGTSTFPVYPELAERFGLGFGGSYYFRAPGTSSDSVLTLPEFVEREFASFAEQGRERLAAEARWPLVQTQLTQMVDS